MQDDNINNNYCMKTCSIIQRVLNAKYVGLPLQVGFHRHCTLMSYRLQILTGIFKKPQVLIL